MTSAIRSRLDRMRDDDGFGLVEVILAMAVTMVVMSALLGVLVQSLGSVAQAKQRQAATALATRVMEQLRAQPYDVVTQPDGTVLAADPNVVSGRFRPAALSGVDEALVVNALSPRMQTVAPENGADGASYVVRQYVTKPPPTTPGEQAYNVTVIVSWSSNVASGKSTVERSTLYSADGCLSTATRPFSGPCQAYFTAQAGQGAAGFTVTSAGGTGDIPGFDGSRLDLVMPVLTSNLLLEQTTSARTSVATTQAKKTSLTPSTSGGSAATAAVDTDPSSATAQAESLTAPAQTSSTLQLSGAAGKLSVRPSTGDTAAAAAAVAAEPAACTAADGTTLTTGTPLRRPCASARVRPQGGAAELTFDPNSLYGFSSLSFPLVRSYEAPVRARAVAAHLTAPNTNACSSGTGAAGVGCAHAAATRALGDVVVGGMPSGTGVPASYAGAWRLTGVTESALAESGTGARVPAYTRAGSLQVWNGTGYTTVALNATSSADYTPATVTGRWSSGGRLMEVTVESALTVRPATTGTAGPADCKAEACVVTSGAVGGLRGQTTYTVTLDGSELTRFTVVSDLSGLLARATYKAAPDA